MIKIIIKTHVGLPLTGDHRKFNPGVTLDRILTCKAHLTYVKGKLADGKQSGKKTCRNKVGQRFRWVGLTHRLGRVRLFHMRMWRIANDEPHHRKLSAKQTGKGSVGPPSTE